MRVSWYAIAGLIIAASDPAIALDIGKAKDRPVGAELQSYRDLFDLERCIIDSDSPVAPIIYQQPDRPTDAMIVYPNVTSVAGLIQLSKIASGTSVTMRALFGGSGAVIKHVVERCAA